MTANHTWRDQLAQLNERARTYTAQQWQVPFAYLAIVGLALNALVKEDGLLGSVALLAAGIVGGLVRWHMWFNRDGAARAVSWIRRLEEEHKKELGGGPTAKYGKWAHVPLEVMVTAVALACGLAGLGYWLPIWSGRAMCSASLVALFVEAVVLIEGLFLVDAFERARKYETDKELS